VLGKLHHGECLASVGRHFHINETFVIIIKVKQPLEQILHSTVCTLLNITMVHQFLMFVYTRIRTLGINKSCFCGFCVLLHFFLLNLELLYIVAYLLKARTVEPEKQLLLCEQL
jgi:hypothetical protein